MDRRWEGRERERHSFSPGELEFIGSGAAVVRSLVVSGGENCGEIHSGSGRGEARGPGPRGRRRCHFDGRAVQCFFSDKEWSEEGGVRALLPFPRILKRTFSMPARRLCPGIIATSRGGRSDGPRKGRGVAEKFTTLWGGGGHGGKVVRLLPSALNLSSHAFRWWPHCLCAAPASLVQLHGAGAVPYLRTVETKADDPSVVRQILDANETSSFEIRQRASHCANARDEGTDARTDKGRRGAAVALRRIALSQGRRRGQARARVVLGDASKLRDVDKF